MGIVYVGPYADDVNHDAYHEGYAARLWRDGTISGSWGGEHGATGHIGLVGACDCGWRSRTIHPPGALDSPQYLAAERDFETEHLDRLVEQARQRSWPLWTRRVTGSANLVTQLVQAGRLGDANDILDSLRDDVSHRSTILAELIQDRQPADQHDPTPRVPAHPFVPIGDDDHPPMPPPAGGPPMPGSPPRHPPTR
jgi:hypothetical protein